MALYTRPDVERIGRGTPRGLFFLGTHPRSEIIGRLWCFVCILYIKTKMKFMYIHMNLHLHNTISNVRSHRKQKFGCSNPSRDSPNR